MRLLGLRITAAAAAGAAAAVIRGACRVMVASDDGEE